MILDNPQMPQTNLLALTVSIYSRRPAPSDYIPYFLLFGAQPPKEEAIYLVYTREATQDEENKWTKKLVKFYEVLLPVDISTV